MLLPSSVCICGHNVSFTVRYRLLFLSGFIGGYCVFVCQSCVTIASILSNEAMSLEAVPKLQRISEVNGKRSGFVFVQTILLNASINLMSEYAVALGHYAIPFEIK